ncbi:MAG: hypothetical protein ACI88A_003678 [Paraglaciecola sp.]|jgi:hypothetical protein
MTSSELKSDYVASLAELVKQQYQSLAKLLKLYREVPLSASHIQQTLEFCDGLINLTKKHPDIFFAQSQLYKSKLPYVLNLCFNSCMLSNLLAVRNKLNDTTNQQLMCASISFFAFEQSKIEAYYSAKKDEHQLGKVDPRLCRALENSHQDCWLGAYNLATTIHQNIQKLTIVKRGLARDQIIISIAIRLALLTTRNSRFKCISFANAIKKITLDSPSDWSEVLQPLMEYPSLTPPGSFLKLPDQSYAIVLAIAKHGHFVQQVSARPQNDINKAAIMLGPKQPKKSMLAQPLINISQLDTFWNSAWDAQNDSRNDLIINPLVRPYTQVFKLDNPPASLLAIQKQLNQDEPDIRKLTIAVEKEPLFAQHLQKTATQSARQKLPIQDIQHSLMMHGFARSGSILMQQSLLSRLNQHYFPLQLQFTNFTQLRGQIASALAKESGLSTPEQACSLAYFANTGLFTLPTLKVLKKWQPKPKRLFDINHLVAIRGGELLHKHAITLAEAWQQSSIEVFALHNHSTIADKKFRGRPGEKLAALLGLSLLSARQFYFAEHDLCDESQSYVENALTTLNISAQTLANLQQQSATFCHTYIALN